MTPDYIISRMAEREFVLIAEIGVNYHDIAEQRGIPPLEAAVAMIDAARAGGAHAVKFQSYKAGTLAARHSPAYWDRTEEPTGSQYELFRKFDAFGEAEYRALAEHCRDTGVEFLSTPFDYESADYLDPLMRVFKISSSDITNIPFIRHMAAKGKPVLLSVGASDADEIRRAVDAIREINNQPLCLLHCVLEYPTPYEHANLAKIRSLAATFPEAIIGYSDHTRPDAGCDVVKAAYALGARVIEKHFTLDKTLAGNDHYHAMDPDDAERIVKGIEFIDTILGKADLVPLASEADARRHARRSLVSARVLAKGSVLSEKDVVCKRPGTGISPIDIGKAVGMTLARDVDADTVLGWDMLR